MAMACISCLQTVVFSILEDLGNHDSLGNSIIRIKICEPPSILGKDGGVLSRCFLYGFEFRTFFSYNVDHSNLGDLVYYTI